MPSMTHQPIRPTFMSDMPNLGNEGDSHRTSRVKVCQNQPFASDLLVLHTFILVDPSVRSIPSDE